MTDDILTQHEDERTECLIYTRVMGYIRPTNSYNAGKQGEFKERVFFEEDTCLC